MTRAEEEFTKEFPEWEQNKGNLTYIKRFTGYLAGWKKRGELDIKCLVADDVLLADGQHATLIELGKQIRKLDEEAQ